MLEYVFLGALIVTNVIWVIIFLTNNVKTSCTLVVNNIEDDFYLKMSDDEYAKIKSSPDGSWISLKLQRIK